MKLVTLGQVRQTLRTGDAPRQVTILGEDFAFAHLKTDGQARLCDQEFSGHLVDTGLSVTLPDDLKLEHDLRLGGYDYYRIPGRST